MGAVEKKRQVFVDTYVENGEDRIKAYQKAYPKCTAESARVKSHKLLQLPAINEAIIKKRKEVAAIVERGIIHQVREQGIENVLSLVRKRELLWKIAEGRIKIPTSKYYWNKSKEKFEAKTLYDLPNHQTRIAAIELDARIAGEIAPTKLFAAVQNVNDQGELDGAVRMFVLSTGERLPLFGGQKK